MRPSIVKNPINSTAVLLRRFCPAIPSLASRLCSSTTDSDTKNSPATQLTRVASLVEGCDYEHWLVVMEAPKEYPLRNEIVNHYIKTLAMALGSEEEAKKSIYSVSTKYYYAFGCKVSENLTYTIKSLPDVKWVLPDSYLCHGENSYGGEPFIDGEVAPYNEVYHEDWIRDRTDDKDTTISPTNKAKEKRKEKKPSVI